jgi:hypothetical protein
MTERGSRPRTGGNEAALSAGSLAGPPAGGYRVGCSVCVRQVTPWGSVRLSCPSVDPLARQREANLKRRTVITGAAHQATAVEGPRTVEVGSIPLVVAMTPAARPRLVAAPPGGEQSAPSARTPGHGGGGDTPGASLPSVCASGGRLSIPP